MITQYTASLSEDGAHIIVPQGAKCFKLAPQDKSKLGSLVSDLSCRAAWFKFASKHLGLSPGTLYLITGLCKAKSWSLASFDRVDGQEVQVCCELVQEGGKLQTGGTDSHWNSRSSFPRKIGPPVERQAGKDNQTIFIQSFAITHNDTIQSRHSQRPTTLNPPSSNRRGARSRSAHSATATNAATKSTTAQYIPPSSSVGCSDPYEPFTRTDDFVD